MIPLRFKMQYHPVVGLNEDEIKLLESYYSLLSRKTDKLNPHFSELAVHKLAHALFYDLYNFVYRHMQDKDFELSLPIVYSTVSSHSLKNITSKNVTLFSTRTNYAWLLNTYHQSFMLQVENLPGNGSTITWSRWQNPYLFQVPRPYRKSVIAWISLLHPPSRNSSNVSWRCPLGNTGTIN